MSLAKRAIFPERNSRQNAIKMHSFPHFPRRKKAFLHLLLNIQETATARPTANNEIEASLPNAYIQQRVAEQGTDALVRFPVDTHRRRNNKKKVIRARILLIQLSQKERSAWIKGSRGVSVKEIPAKQTALIATRWHEQIAGLNTEKNDPAQNTAAIYLYLKTNCHTKTAACLVPGVLNCKKTRVSRHQSAFAKMSGQLSLLLFSLPLDSLKTKKSS